MEIFVVLIEIKDTIPRTQAFHPYVQVHGEIRQDVQTLFFCQIGKIKSGFGTNDDQNIVNASQFKHLLQTFLANVKHYKINFSILKLPKIK